MGFLTTITIYNDGCALIKEHPDEFVKKVHQACLGFQVEKGQNWDSIGNFGNLLTLQKPRHADSHTLYVHAGNTVMDVDLINDPESKMLDHALAEMRFHTKRLLSLKKLRASKKKQK